MTIRLRVSNVSVDIDSDAALSIINMISRGIKDVRASGTADQITEAQDAEALRDLLSANFQESHSGIHYEHRG